MRRILGVIVLITITQIAGLAQTPFFQQYFLLRKNDPVQINKILQDKNGFMWFATSNGLFKFDGKIQRRYTKKQGLLSNVVTAVAEDSLGRIWIGYQDGRLSFFEKNNFHSFDPPEGNTTKTISDILFDKNGNLWFATWNDGLYYYMNNRLYRVDEAEGLPDLYIYDLAEDSQGNIWAGTDGGAAVCTLQGSKISIDVIDHKDGLPDNIIRKIIQENDHAVLLATEDAGIIRYDLATHNFGSLTKHSWQYGGVSDFAIKNNKIWIACPQRGLVVYDRVKESENLYTAESIQGLASLRVLAKDTEGNIWAGAKSGLLRTPGDNLEYIEKPSTGSDANILAVTVDQFKNVWFSNKEGLYKRELKPNQNGIVKPLASSPYENYTVISLFVDSKGYIWAGLYGEGALRIDPVTGKIRHFSRELRNGNILNITGKENIVWLATLGGSTKIDLLDNNEVSIKNYSSDDGLISDFIYQIFLQNDRVWFATDGKGIAMMDQDGFHHYEDGLPNAVVYGMAEDANHKLWVNVQGHGLYTFDGKQFHACDSAVALRDTDIHSLTSDKSGNIVVMHDAGMDVIDVRKNKIIYLGDEVGLREKIANLNAVGKDSSGHIFFGTSAGIIKYAGEEDHLSSKPKAQIENVFLFDKPIDLAIFPILEHDENNITVNFLGLWYRNPDGLFYSYKLENYDRDWIETTNHSVTYSRLPPGKYTYRLRVSETPDFNNTQEASVTFTILPPIWQTIPFYIFMVVIAGALGYTYVKHRERQLRRDNEVLETTVNMRTMEIQLQKEEIMTQNEEISSQSEEILVINENLENLVKERTQELERKNKILEEYAFINAHKLRSPVATILGLINLFSKTKLDTEGEEINRRLQHTANELDDIVRTITKAIERGERKIPKRKDD